METNHSLQTHDRRSALRVPCEILATSRQFISNISQTGFYLETDEEYQMQQDIPLSFKMGSFQKKLNLVGKIARRERLKSEKFGYGLSFQYLGEDEFAMIGSFIKKEATFLKVKGVIFEVIPEATHTIFHREASMISDLHVDSLKVAELSILLEQAFQRSIFLPDWLTSQEDPKDLTVNSLVNFLVENEGTLQ